MEQLTTFIEALLFVSDSPLSISDLKKSLVHFTSDPIEEGQILAAIEQLEARYRRNNSALSIAKIGGGFQLLTHESLAEPLKKVLASRQQKPLSRSLLETLAIVAYRQPITRAEIEQIRGVDCSYALQRLLDMGLITIQGRAELPGNPLLYGTTPHFLEYFQISSLKELPKPQELYEDQQNLIDEAERYLQKKEEA